MARCGKDTFAKMLNEFIPTFKYSSIDKIKLIAKTCGWDGKKEENDRKFLSDLKLLTSQYNDLPFKSIKKTVEMFYKDSVYEILLIDIREPEEIERAKKEFGAKTILILNDRVKQISSNMADANVYDYNYDFVIENNGTLDDFKKTVENFANFLANKNKPDLFIDFDGCITDTITSIVSMYNDDFQYYKNFEEINPDDIKTYGFEECNCASKEIINTYFNTKRFFDNLEFMPNALTVLSLLARDFNIKIVSHGFSPNLAAKRIWLEKYLPCAELIGINLKEHSDKKCVDMSGCIFIDDKVSNLDSSNAKHKIIFGKKYPWNEEENGYTRCENWVDLYKEIIRLTK